MTEIQGRKRKLRILRKDKEIKEIQGRKWKLRKFKEGYGN